MAVIYLRLADAVSTHEKTIELSGGGQLGALDLGRLEAVLEHIQNDEYYPTFVEKLTHLFFSIVKFHCFQDGNKRTAIAVCAHMLLLNGYLYCAGNFITEMENISVYVADGSINKELLHDILVAHLALEADDEVLKFRILDAITAPRE